MLNQLFLGLCGAFFRRWWGGWENPNHVLKVALGFVLAFLIAYILTASNLIAALGFGVIIGCAFLNPFHGWAMGMGQDGSGKSTIACIAVMGGSYGFFTVAAAGWLCWWTQHTSFLFFALHGFVTPIPYLISWLIFNKWFRVATGVYDKFWQTSKGQWFIDFPTAVGELFLGALLFSL